MGCCGVIAEYNPFHLGHAYQLRQAKALSGGAPIIVAMSGSLVQRGDIAAFDKRLRAKWALQNGADLVLELPALFSLAHAERFALGGVALLQATGLLDSLSFGAEDAELAVLEKAAKCSLYEYPAFQERLSHHLAAGRSFPAARAAALQDWTGDPDLACIAAKPNNILAIEYLKAVRKLDSAARPIAVGRVGSAHDAAPEAGCFASASALRQAMEQCNMDLLRSGVPDSVYADAYQRIAALSAPASIATLDGPILYALRRLSCAELAQLPDVAEGLENVFYTACRECTSYSELLRAVKSKRYTLARLRRICLCALMGITKSDWAANPLPRYLRVLGVRKESVDLLSQLSREATLPIVMGKADCDCLEPIARRALALDLFAGELFAMASPHPQPAAFEFSFPLLTVE